MPLMMLVFDAAAWQAVGHDVGDNSCFWKQCELLHLEFTTNGEPIYTVRFPDGRISRGHFYNTMREIPNG